jgi:UDP-N-acetylmuramate dehydrogenase
MDEPPTRPPPDILHEVDLAPYTTLEVGGAAQQFLEVADEATLADALRWARGSGHPVTIIGGGSNVVVADRGVRGLVIRLALRGFEVQDTGDGAVVVSGAGEPWDDVVQRVVDEGLTGIECLSGIPGTAGATPIQNVGAYGQEIGDVLESVEVVDRDSIDVTSLRPEELDLGYRSSRLRRNHGLFVVLRLSLRVRRGSIAEIRYPELQRALSAGGASPSPERVRESVLDLRRSKSMVVEPGDPNRRSVGSFFLNPVLDASAAARLERRVAVLAIGRAVPLYPAPGGRVKTSAAWLIEHAGFPKGFGDGSVGLSSRHTLAIVNRGGATAAAIVKFAQRIRHTVHERFGILLQPEPTFIGFDSPNPLDEPDGS